MEKRIPVTILGATGSVGQRFVQLLDGHPWFEVVTITGSERSAGQTYGEACNWLLQEPIPKWAEQMNLVRTQPNSSAAKIAFSALPADEARNLEPLYAQAGIAVCSNASAFRREPDVPVLLPEVNPEHANIVGVQRRKRGWAGCIVTNPNCTSTGLTVALKALDKAFGIRRVIATSLQAISGAGYPGVASLDILDNVIPYIGGEEEKLEWEPRKMLGQLRGDQIELATVKISAHTNRVAVSDGHMVCASVECDSPTSLVSAARALSEFQPSAISAALPSNPHPTIILRAEPDRPQPRLDRLSGKGMTTVIGRLRKDPVFDLKFVVLSHNTVRGAAGGSIFNAELLVQMGLIG